MLLDLICCFPNMENARFSITANPTFWDQYVAALTLIRFQGTLIIFHAILPLVSLFILVGSLWERDTFGAEEVRLILFGFCFTPFLAALGVWMRRRRKSLGKGPFTFSFDEEGVHTSTAKLNQTIKWPAVVRLRQSKRHLFIFVSPWRALIIPKKALIDQGVLEEIRKIIGQHTDFR